MRVPSLTALVCGAIVALSGCGEQADPVALPASGSAYRALGGDERLAIANSCREVVP